MTKRWKPRGRKLSVQAEEPREVGRTQLIRVRRETYEELDALRQEFRLNTTDIVAAMVAGVRSKSAVDLKKWRDELPPLKVGSPQDRWFAVEKEVFDAVWQMQMSPSFPDRVPISDVMEGCEGVSKPQVERALSNLKNAGIVRVDLEKHEVWCEDIDGSIGLAAARFLAKPRKTRKV